MDFSEQDLFFQVNYDDKFFYLVSFPHIAEDLSRKYTGAKLSMDSNGNLHGELDIEKGVNISMGSKVAWIRFSSDVEDSYIIDSINKLIETLVSKLGITAFSRIGVRRAFTKVVDTEAELTSLRKKVSNTESLLALNSHFEIDIDDDTQGVCILSFGQRNQDDALEYGLIVDLDLFTKDDTDASSAPTAGKELLETLTKEIATQKYQEIFGDNSSSNEEDE